MSGIRIPSSGKAGSSDSATTGSGTLSCVFGTAACSTTVDFGAAHDASAKATPSSANVFMFGVGIMSFPNRVRPQESRLPPHAQGRTSARASLGVAAKIRGVDISVHLPMRGGRLLQGNRFNPCPLGRGDHSRGAIVGNTRGFNPRPSCEGRLTCQASRPRDKRVSIRAPLARGDRGSLESFPP